MTDPMHFTRAVLAMLALLFTAPLAAQTPDMSAFAPGPVFADFGPHAPVEGVEDFPADSEFRIAFDVSTQADEGTRNRGFESAARFINMHAAHGVEPANIDIAVVVHGKAVFDLTTRDGNDSAVMVRAPVTGSCSSFVLTLGAFPSRQPAGSPITQLGAPAALAGAAALPMPNTPTGRSPNRL